MAPHINGEDGGGCVEADEGHPHAPPAGHLVAGGAAHSARQQKEEHHQRKEHDLERAVDAQGLRGARLNLSSGSRNI